MRVIHYTRVSTREQVNQGNSLDVQSRRLREDSEREGHIVVAEETDAGKSAKNLRRGGLQSALGRLRSGEADCIKVAKLDRLTRSVEDWCRLRREYWHKGKTLVSLGDGLDLTSPHGRFLALMQIAMGELEREQTGERVSTVAQDRKKRGLRYCRGVYGHRTVEFIGESGKSDTRFEPCPDQQRIIERMYADFSRGSSLGEIAGRLNADGIPSPNGGRWYPTTVSRVLARHEEGMGV